MDKQASQAVPISEWVEAFGDTLYRHAILRLKNEHDAQDCVQETLLAALKYRSSFTTSDAGDISKSQLAWMIGILTNKIHDFHRRRPRGGVKGLSADKRVENFDKEEADQLASLEESPSERVEVKDLWGLVQGCIATLSEPLADVFVMAAIHRLESSAICSELKISSDAFYVRLHRARLAIAACVKHKWPQAQALKAK